jgi:predicted glycoside hydrolase/deacetylase ChbG (UPF0249 family)
MKRTSSPFQRAVLALTFLLCLVVLPLYAYKVSLKNDYTDFEVYYRTAERAKNLRWNEIYSLKDGASPFRYAPLFIPLFRPFAEFSLATARVIWFFLQYIWFGLGFYFIYLTLRFTLKPRDREHALFLTGLGILFILRFCLDTFTIGQVSSLMFLGFCVGLYGWVSRQPRIAVAGLLIPTLFKIGPGFLFGTYLAAKKKERNRAATTAIGGTLLLVLAATLALGRSAGSSLGWPVPGQKLWSDWKMIVANDSVYYDSSHYGNQSVNGFLLRGVRDGWLSAGNADRFYLALAFVVCVGTAFFLALRRPTSLYGRGAFFSLGLFVYIWLMPETFKYSQTPLAIPVVFLFAWLLGGTPTAPGEVRSLVPSAHSGLRSLFQNAWAIFALTFGGLVLSIAGKDIVGDRIFFGSQQASLPLLATLFLGIATWQLAWRNSKSSPIARKLFEIVDGKKRRLGPWESIPAADRPLDASLLIPVPVHSASTIDPDLFRKMIWDLREVLGDLQYEILLIPYGNRLSPAHPLVRTLSELAAQSPTSDTPTHGPRSAQIQILSHRGFTGRGAALRTGFLASRGRRILSLQAEQPCDPSFFRHAVAELDAGSDLVRANRRDGRSKFIIPVRLLPLVYGRHRLGLAFNRLVRAVLPITTTDTHAGSFALSARLAFHTFALQTSPDFLFDLELSLTSRANGYREIDLPVAVSLTGEKPIQRIGLETLNILLGLPALAWRYRQDYYRVAAEAPSGITADDWGLSPGVNQGILQLAQLGVVKRVSIMASCPFRHEGLAELLQLHARGKVELGLHFNLTYGKPAQPSPDSRVSLVDHSGPRSGLMVSSPGKFLWRWWQPGAPRALNRHYVRAELQSQLESLKQSGIPVQYLDGHHHIHIIPGLIDALADVIQAAQIKMVRLPYDGALWFSAQAPIALFALLARSRLRSYGFVSRPCFYPQKIHFQDQGRFRARLAKLPHAEVIVHPSTLDDVQSLELPDIYSAGRVDEFRALRMLGLQP